jgi:BirA family biotin operon repressor/biotin-[acetyl-CoA-carboxylase] ligase
MKIKDRILRYLEENRGVYLSGEQLSKQLHITRQAVWKNIKSLVADGYDIHSVPNKGYMLDGVCDVLSATLISAKVNATVFCYDELASTNEEAKLKFRQDGDCVIVADRQTNSTQNETQNNNGEYISIALNTNFLYKNMNTYRERCTQIVADLIANTCGKPALVQNGDSIFVDNVKVCDLRMECELNVFTEEVTCVYIGIAFFIRSQLINEIISNDEMFYRLETRNNLIASIFNQIKSIKV